MLTLRKVFTEKDKEIAFGLDHMNGVFLQVFSEIDGEQELIEDYDQSLLLTGFQFSSPINREIIINTLTKYSSTILEEYLIFEKEPLSDLVIGYATNQDGFYPEKVFIRTNGDWINFFNSVDKHFILTDGLDLLIAKR